MNNGQNNQPNRNNNGTQVSNQIAKVMQKIAPENFQGMQNVQDQNNEKPIKSELIAKHICSNVNPGILYNILKYNDAAHGGIDEIKK